MERGKSATAHGNGQAVEQTIGKNRDGEPRQCHRPEGGFAGKKQERARPEQDPGPVQGLVGQAGVHPYAERDGDTQTDSGDKSTSNVHG